MNRTMLDGSSLSLIFFGLKYEAVVEGWWYFSAMLLIHTFLPKTVSHNIWAKSCEAWQTVPEKSFQTVRADGLGFVRGKVTAYGVCPGTSGRSHKSVARLVRKAAKSDPADLFPFWRQSLKDMLLSCGGGCWQPRKPGRSQGKHWYSRTHGRFCMDEDPLWGRSPGKVQGWQTCCLPKTGGWSRAQWCLGCVVTRGGTGKPGKAVVSSCSGMLHKTYGPSSSKLMLFITGRLGSWKGRWNQDRKVEKNYFPRCLWLNIHLQMTLVNERSCSSC